MLLSVDGCVVTAPLPQTVHYTNPAWAPEYYPGVRYYYLPDIEVYYDLSNQNFVYLNNGFWTTSPSLPAMYGSYNLYGAYVVGLNVRVYKPWLHNEYYVTHYPRYYYRTVYTGPERETIRGFNENIRKPFVHPPQARNDFNEVRRQVNTPSYHNNLQQQQTPVYRGRRVGRPVRVNHQMREQKEVVKETKTLRRRQ